MKPTGFIVIEQCEDWEQVLALIQGKNLPPGGILDWPLVEPVKMRSVFASKSDARAAVERTEHYRLAYGRKDLPEKCLCRLVGVCDVPPKEAP